MTEIAIKKKGKQAIAHRPAYVRKIRNRVDKTKNRNVTRAITTLAQKVALVTNAAKNMHAWETAIANSKEPAVTVLASSAMVELEMRIIQGGVLPDAFYKVAGESKIPVADLAKALGMNERTIQRKKKSGELLDEDMSERTFRGLKVWTMAKDTLKGIEDPHEWLWGSIRSLGGAAPISMLGTAVGERRVVGVLEAIEYGVYL
jgi:putative toxin-antitoxin system antitoxin component (TIGR02293 family)